MDCGNDLSDLFEVMKPSTIRGDSIYSKTPRHHHHHREQHHHPSSSSSTPLSPPPSPSSHEIKNSGQHENKASTHNDSNSSGTDGQQQHTWWHTYITKNATPSPSPLLPDSTKTQNFRLYRRLSSTAVLLPRYTYQRRIMLLLQYSTTTYPPFAPSHNCSPLLHIPATYHAITAVQQYDLPTDCGLIIARPWCVGDSDMEAAANHDTSAGNHDSTSTMITQMVAKRQRRSGWVRLFARGGWE